MYIIDLSDASNHDILSVKILLILITIIFAFLLVYRVLGPDENFDKGLILITFLTPLIPILLFVKLSFDEQLVYDKDKLIDTIHNSGYEV